MLWKQIRPYSVVCVIKSYLLRDTSEKESMMLARADSVKGELMVGMHN